MFFSFRMAIHIDLVCVVNFLEFCKDERVYQKKYLCWFLVKYIKISDIFYKIQNMLRTSLASIIFTRKSNKTFSSQALEEEKINQKLEAQSKSSLLSSLSWVHKSGLRY